MNVAPPSAQTPLAITPGEPAGIGPDILLALAAEGLAVPAVAFADRNMLAARARRLGLEVALVDADEAGDAAPGRLAVFHLPCAVPVEPGLLAAANAGYVTDTLDAAVQAITQGHCSGLVTGPVHKGIINEAGVPFTGHTEYVAERCKGDPVMMLVAPGLRVALATTHLPLSRVADALDARTVGAVLRIVDRDLRERFDIAQPRILVCGVNPHAGEDGYLGREEVDWLIPLLERLRAQGLHLDGPRPADTAFVPAHRAHADAVLAMYHDQGLPVLKALGFGDAVNVTLGLSIVRTSVDHGTALDLAGRGVADASSLRAAVALAAQLTGLTRR